MFSPFFDFIIGFVPATVNLGGAKHTAFGANDFFLHMLPENPSFRAAK
ncbi:MAG: hypothetical protein IJL52_02185 [Clostridia bacterium]|nr:hypothetical protein [Clostridia bacterium]